MSDVVGVAIRILSFYQPPYLSLRAKKDSAAGGGRKKRLPGRASALSKEFSDRTGLLCRSILKNNEEKRHLRLLPVGSEIIPI